MRKNYNPVKILFTSPILKYPPIGGPALRIFNSLISLSKISDVHILFQVPDKNLIYKRIPKIYSKVFRNSKILFQNINIKPSILQKIIWYIEIKYQSPWKKIRNIVWAKQIVDYAKEKRIKIVWFGYGNISYDLIRLVRLMNPNLKLVCDTDSVWSKYVLGRTKYVRDQKEIRLIKKEGKIKEIEEKKLIRICDVVTAVSDVDKEYYLHIATKNDKVKIKRFSNVINPLSYKNIPRPLDIPSGSYIYMSGSFGKGTPMEDGACWFIESVLPILNRYIPNIKLLIIGNNADWVLSKYKGRKNILIKRWVRNTSPYLKHTKVSIVPLRYESGTRFKILEAGICAIPVVSTTLGAEGLEVEHGKNILIADSSDGFARSILEIINKPIRAKYLASNLHEFVLKNYTIKNLSEEGRIILRDIV